MVLILVLVAVPGRLTEAVLRRERCLLLGRGGVAGTRVGSTTGVVRGGVHLIVDLRLGLVIGLTGGAGVRATVALLRLRLTATRGEKWVDLRELLLPIPWSVSWVVI